MFVFDNAFSPFEGRVYKQMPPMGGKIFPTVTLRDELSSPRHVLKNSLLMLLFL